MQRMNPDKGDSVVLPRSPTRSGVSEGDRPLTSVSNPNKGVPVFSLRPPARSSASESNRSITSISGISASTCKE